MWMQASRYLAVGWPLPGCALAFPRMQVIIWMLCDHSLEVGHYLGCGLQHYLKVGHFLDAVRLMPGCGLSFTLLWAGLYMKVV